MREAVVEAHLEIRWRILECARYRGVSEAEAKRCWSEQHQRLVEWAEEVPMPDYP